MAADALDQVRDRGHIGIRLGLARMQALLRNLDDPQTALRGALIGGTNGKGSTQAMVAAMLASAGHRVLQSPSPHLSSYRERIVVGDEPILRADLDSTLADVLAASVPGEPEHGPATQFELLTAAAFLWGARQAVDVAVIEVGLGGRLDASNVWSAGVSVVTNVGLDHQQYLGDSVELIAAEKSAIIKPGDVAVTGATEPARSVIAEHCERLGVRLHSPEPLRLMDMNAEGTTLEHAEMGTLHTPLLGRFQSANAAIALATVEALATAGIVETPPESRRAGLARTRWPGRMELMRSDGVTLLLDGAHNPDGTRQLAATVDALAPDVPGGRVTLLIGAMADKDVPALLGGLTASRRLHEATLVASVVPDTDRSTSPAAIADAWSRRPEASSGPAPIASDDADEALDVAFAIAHEQGGLLVVAGSLYLVGHVRARLRPDEHPVDR